MSHLIKALYSAICFLCCCNASGQTYNTFNRYYGTSGYSDINSIARLSSGCYLVASSAMQQVGTGQLFCSSFLKVNSRGDSVAYKLIGDTISPTFFRNIESCRDGGAIILGQLNSLQSNSEFIYLVKTNNLGDTLWTRILGDTIHDFLGYAIEANDGGFILSYSAYDSSTSHVDSSASVGLLKLDPSGNTIWNKTYNFRGATFGIAQSSDSGYVLSIGTSGISGPSILMEVNLIGDSLWSKQYSIASLHNIQVGMDGSIFGICGSGIITSIFKANGQGDSLWIRDFQNIGSGSGGDYVITRDNGVAVVGGVVDLNQEYGILIKLNRNGDTLWSLRDYGLGKNEFHSIDESLDGQLVVSGFSVDTLTSIIYTSVQKYRNRQNIVRGKTYADLDNSCSYNTGDLPIKNVLIKADSGPYYAMSDSAGNYVIYLDSGGYSVSSFSPDLIWDISCQQTYNIVFVNRTDSSFNNNFNFVANYYCPKLWNAISTVGTRKCSYSTFTVDYCNLGMLPQDSVWIEVDFGPHLLPNTSTLPWYANNGSKYYFAVGTLDFRECGQFNVSALVDCQATFGSSCCVTSRILPDTSCIQPDSSFDYRQVLLIGECLGDSLRFTIKNTHPSAYYQEGLYYLYENNVLIHIDTFRVASGDSILIHYPSNGNTIRLHLFYMRFPNTNMFEGAEVTIEGCGANPVYGQVGQFSNNTGQLNFSEVCSVINASLDPNDKGVSPIGLGSNHLTSRSDELEYTIRFQNAGNAPAYTVMIRDTLSDKLDITSFRNGQSSHPCSFNMYGSGIAEWVFNDIVLPDSSTNEPDSHGYVTFRINQKAGNLPGSVISNTAQIYFDFNEPVITNTTENIICDTVVSDFSYLDNGGQVQFINASTNANIYYWNFGDGSADTATNPEHQYAQNGTYDVCLVSNSDCERDISCDQINVTSVGIGSNYANSGFEIYPNPVSDFINITSDQKNESRMVVVRNIYGKELNHYVFRNLRVLIPLGDYTAGVYILEIITESKNEILKVLKD